MNTKRFYISVLTAAIFATMLLAGSRILSVNAQQTSPATMEVKIDNFSFGPGTLTIPAGTTAGHRTNRDDIPHTVVSTEGAFKSKVLDTDEKFSFTFSKPGGSLTFLFHSPKDDRQVVVQ